MAESTVRVHGDRSGDSPTIGNYGSVLDRENTLVDINIARSYASVHEADLIGTGLGQFESSEIQHRARCAAAQVPSCLAAKSRGCRERDILKRILLIVGAAVDDRA